MKKKEEKNIYKRRQSGKNDRFFFTYEFKMMIMTNKRKEKYTSICYIISCKRRSIRQKLNLSVIVYHIVLHYILRV